MFVEFYTRCQLDDSVTERPLTSMSFLLRASLALSSRGLYPACFAMRCAEVVFPIPGGPEIRTAR